VEPVKTFCRNGAVMTHEQIAQHLGLTRREVQRAEERALKKLRVALLPLWKELKGQA